MKCVACKGGETRSGTTTVTLERDGTTMVFKHVPAEVCVNCGEAYTDERISRKLVEMAEQAAASGVQVDIREFSSAIA